MIEGWTKDDREMIGVSSGDYSRRVGAGMPQVGRSIGAGRLNYGFTMNYPWLANDILSCCLFINDFNMVFFCQFM